MLWLSSWCALVAPLLLPIVVQAKESDQQPLKGKPDNAACPEYGSYATFPHPPLTDGPLKLPFQRPNPRCRTFQSDAIEKVIKDVTSRMKDPALARLFENTFPSTTDTTVRFHTNGKNEKIKQKLRSRKEKQPWLDDGEWAGPQSFVITGDILAEWLRDSTNQLKPYQALATKDPAIFNLILGAINTQSEYVIQSPYCNAFQPPPISGLPISYNGQDDAVHPAYEPSTVFECKYELDSLAHFLALVNDFHQHTGGSRAFLNGRWYKAVKTLISVLETQSRSTFDSEHGGYQQNAYTFQRRTNTGTETLNLNGVGNPLNNDTGLVRSAFRPSDDATIFGFFIPANAQMAVELRRTVAMLRSDSKDTATSPEQKKLNKELAQTLEDYATRITRGIREHGIVPHRQYGEVYAYEVDGYGSALLMDDANYPSLLALPRMGFVGADDPVYRNTRRMLLEKTGNPYFLTGKEFRGIGGPHIGLQNAWPMSLLIQAQTSDNDEEIMGCLQLVLSSSKLGLIHESVNVNHAGSYTRSWFAWANGVFAETILDLAKRKPHLIFKEAKPYIL
ncbi:Six-hairpin glycosidase-like protein [Chaetomium sp. MPI-SDFR-AT-0129]|nr:Six-hairpin glycosidase-like protein [Chaetomium sp. MPI-SDFR-AT-0129]